MFELTDELLRNAADTANKATGETPDDDDVGDARMAWIKGQYSVDEQNLSRWGYIAFGFIECARQMAEEAANGSKEE